MVDDLLARAVIVAMFRKIDASYPEELLQDVLTDTFTGRILEAIFQDRMLQQTGGQLLVAYRNLSDLSDDDLRRLLETLDAEPEEP